MAPEDELGNGRNFWFLNFFLLLNSFVKWKNMYKAASFYAKAIYVASDTLVSVEYINIVTWYKFFLRYSIIFCAKKVKFRNQ